MNLFAPGYDRDDWDQEKHLARLTGRNVKLHLIDVTRRATHHRSATKLQMVSYEPDVHDHAGDETVDRVLEREELRELADGIKDLPAVWARCLLWKMAGYSREEIAKVEGIGWKSVDNYVTKARRALRAAA